MNLRSFLVIGSLLIPNATFAGDVSVVEIDEVSAAALRDSLAQPENSHPNSVPEVGPAGETRFRLDRQTVEIDSPRTPQAPEAENNE